MSDIPQPFAPLPTDRLYDAGRHMWFQPLEGDPDGGYRLGLTAIGAQTLGRILAFMPKRAGRHIPLDAAFATLESGKWVGAARLPFAATILSTHDELIDNPEPINGDPYGAGWLITLRPDDAKAARAVLAAAGETVPEKAVTEAPPLALPPADPAGYLRDFDAWSAEVAEAIARAEGLTLTPEHWEVIDFLRGYYRDFLIAPAIRVLSRALARRLGPEKGDRATLDRLFPGGPAKQACKIAGLPRPTGCL